MWMWMLFEGVWVCRTELRWQRGSPTTLASAHTDVAEVRPGDVDLSRHQLHGTRHDAFESQSPKSPVKPCLHRL
jgi:hypothetical protein